MTRTHEGILSTVESINAADRYLAPRVPMIEARHIARMNLHPRQSFMEHLRQQIIKHYQAFHFNK